MTRDGIYPLDSNCQLTTWIYFTRICFHTDQHDGEHSQRKLNVISILVSKSLAMPSKRYMTPIQTLLDRIMRDGTITVLNTWQAGSSADFFCVFARLGKITFTDVGEFGAGGLSQVLKISVPWTRCPSRSALSDIVSDDDKITAVWVRYASGNVWCTYGTACHTYSVHSITERSSLTRCSGKLQAARADTPETLGLVEWCRIALYDSTWAFYEVIHWSKVHKLDIIGIH